MGKSRRNSRKKNPRIKTDSYRYLREINCNNIEPLKYLLKSIDYKIKFLHPCYIPKNDPRRPFYVNKLKEYLREKRLRF